MKNLFFLMIALLSITACSEDEETVVKEDFTSTIFTSNNTDGNIRYYSVDNSGSITNGMEITTSSTAADGVFYNDATDEIIQASRSGFGIDFIGNASTSIPENTVEAQVFESGTMESPRELATSGDFIVVADNADVDNNDQTPDGRLFIFTRTDDGVSLRNTITTDFKLWGITFIGNDLYAVVDADDELAVFTNFLSNTGDVTISASKRVVIEGIIRTHGLAYDAATNVMIMTDIGDAGNTEDDGGFHIIENFSSVFDGTADGGMITLANQTRVSGANTMMGNPVDVAYDGANDVVYIAEIGNGGGRLLSFKDAMAGGNLQPTSNIEISKISCVYLNK